MSPWTLPNLLPTPVRFIDLASGSVSDATAVLNPERAVVDAPLQPQFEYVIPYPHIAWAGTHAFLDGNGALRVVSANERDSFSIPPPDYFHAGANQVVDLRVSPNERCLVMNLREASGVTVIRHGERTGGTVTWVAPLEPGATWTWLDVALVGRREVYEPPAMETLPAMDNASPVATPG